MKHWFFWSSWKGNLTNLEMVTTGSVVLIYCLSKDHQRVANKKMGYVLGQKVIET